MVLNETISKQVATNTKLESQGTVKLVIGEAKALDQSGFERQLQSGDKVSAGEIIITAANGVVVIELPFDHLLIQTHGQSIALDNDLFKPDVPISKELTPEQMQALIDIGGDPITLLPSTAGEQHGVILV